MALITDRMHHTHTRSYQQLPTSPHTILPPLSIDVYQLCANFNFLPLYLLTVNTTYAQIFYSSESLECIEKLALPSVEEVTAEGGGLPNTKQGSDHVPLAATFTMPQQTIQPHSSSRVYFKVKYSYKRVIIFINSLPRYPSLLCYQQFQFKCCKYQICYTYFIYFYCN